jgi:ABC-type lipoprotein export system ATPase subunit
MGEPIISVKNVDKTFKLASGDVQILHDISLDIEPRSFTIIYGPSGSGKTTLLNTLSTLEQPTKGTVVINGQHVYDLASDQRAGFRSKNLGLMYQTNYWVKSLSVLENVAMPLYVAGWEISMANKKAFETLKQLHMEEYADYRPMLLSGGQQQRVSMARALVADPTIVLADEPTGNLDTKAGDMVMDLLKTVQKEFGRTVVLITHNLDYLPYSDKQIHILDGRVVANDYKEGSGKKPKKQATKGEGSDNE